MDHRLSLNELNSRLLTSANRGDKITVKNLIDMGADVNIANESANESGGTALM
jgi:hypothetical protein